MFNLTGILDLLYAAIAVATNCQAGEGQVPPMPTSYSTRRSPRPPLFRVVRRFGRVPRFSLAKLMLLFTIFCAAGAALSYLGQGLRSPQATNMRFVLFSLVAPPMLWLVVSLLVTLVTAWKRRSQPRSDGPTVAAPDDPDRPAAGRATRRFGAVRKSPPGRPDKFR